MTFSWFLIILTRQHCNHNRNILFNNGSYKIAETWLFLTFKFTNSTWLNLVCYVTFTIKTDYCLSVNYVFMHNEVEIILCITSRKGELGGHVQFKLKINLNMCTFHSKPPSKFSMLCQWWQFLLGCWFVTVCLKLCYYLQPCNLFLIHFPPFALFCSVMWIHPYPCCHASIVHYFRLHWAIRGKLHWRKTDLTLWPRRIPCLSLKSLLFKLHFERNLKENNSSQPQLTLSTFAHILWVQHLLTLFY